MLDRLKNLLKFRLERLLLLGVHFRLLVIASLVGLVAIGGGLLVQATDAPFDDRETAIWWAFLRLTDPGYLGDDEGLARRVISTAMTVLGYVLFMGSLIAIMTQWLNQTVRNLERGLTPIARRNHILILGWTNRTAVIVGELMRSEGRVRRFLQLRGARGLHLVILSEDVSLERAMELRKTLGEWWQEKKITFRSGTPLRISHLERVDFQNASAIILPGADFVYGSADESDMRIVKTLLSIANRRAEGRASLPLLVTEIFDPNKVAMAQRAYRGIVEILASDVFISRCLAQTVRHPGLSRVFHEVLSYGSDNNNIYVHVAERVAGCRFGDLAGAYPKAILLGVARPHGAAFRSMLNPSKDLILASQDRLVFLAREYRDCEFPDWDRPKPASDPALDVPRVQVEGKRRILILGWSHKAAVLIKEFGRQVDERFEIAVLSLIPVTKREAEVAQMDVDQARVSVTHREGDNTSLSDLKAMNPSDYDNVVILGSDWLETQDESDARTIVGHLVLKNALDEKTGPQPKILVDLMDADNVALFDDCDTEVLITPMIASHVLAQVALRRELNVIYEELFAAGGAEICFRPVSDYGIADREVDFGKLKTRVGRRGEIALGIRTARGEIALNPARDKSYKLGETDDLIVLVRGDRA